MLETRKVRIGRADIHYQVTGAGPPVVLVHGLSGSTRWWRRNIDPLSEAFRVHLIDLIGFGRSRARHAFVLAEAAAYLTRWMDRVGIDRASVVGHSMGGFIAADLAAHFPDRVDRLVLVDAAALPLDRSHVGHAVGLVRALWYVPLSFLPVLFTDALRAGPVSILKAARELLTTDIGDRLEKVAAPTLVVWGEKDTLVPRAIGEALMAHLPDAAFTLIEGAGHNPMWDRPAAFNHAVLEFLAPSAPSSADTHRDVTS